MKSVVNGVIMLVIMVVVVWLLASFVNINMCNDFGENYQNFADWNFFTILQKVITK